MPLITPDVSEVSSPLAPGDYQVRVTGVELGKWERQDGTQTPYLNFTLETCGSSEQAQNGRRVWHKTPISGKGAFLFANMFKAATREDYVKGEAIDTDMFLGKELMVTVEDGINRQTGEKTGYLEVKAVRPV